jgi:AhpD family alkylhydroperoxidase
MTGPCKTAHYAARARSRPTQRAWRQALALAGANMPQGLFSGEECMATVKLVNYDEASPEVRAVFDDIMATRNTAYVNNIWRALAVHPPLLRRFWQQMKEVMVKPSRLDPLTKELIYLAVSITNSCEYCINSHTAAARKKGLDDPMLAELNEIVALANAGNRLTTGLQVEVDEVFLPQARPAPWKAGTANGAKGAPRRKRAVAR